MAADVRSSGQSVYVPVYSHILFGDRAARFNLAATLIIRNADPLQTITVRAADYHDSGGRLLKSTWSSRCFSNRLRRPRCLSPKATPAEGFGASFIVRWASEKPATPPVIECIMIGTCSARAFPSSAKAGSFRKIQIEPYAEGEWHEEEIDPF
jgi:hypothetical protein